MDDLLNFNDDNRAPIRNENGAPSTINQTTGRVGNNRRNMIVAVNRGNRSNTNRGNWRMFRTHPYMRSRLSQRPRTALSNGMGIGINGQPTTINQETGIVGNERPNRESRLVQRSNISRDHRRGPRDHPYLRSRRRRLPITELTNDMGGNNNNTVNREPTNSGIQINREIGIMGNYAENRIDHYNTSTTSGDPPSVIAAPRDRNRRNGLTGTCQAQRRRDILEKIYFRRRHRVHQRSQEVFRPVNREPVETFNGSNNKIEDSDTETSANSYDGDDSSSISSTYTTDSSNPATRRWERGSVIEHNNSDASEEPEVLGNRENDNIFLYSFSSIAITSCPMLNHYETSSTSCNLSSYFGSENREKTGSSSTKRRGKKRTVIKHNNSEANDEAEALGNDAGSSSTTRRGEGRSVTKQNNSEANEDPEVLGNSGNNKNMVYSSSYKAISYRSTLNRNMMSSTSSTDSSSSEANFEVIGRSLTTRRKQKGSAIGRNNSATKKKPKNVGNRNNL